MRRTANCCTKIGEDWMTKHLSGICYDTLLYSNKPNSSNGEFAGKIGWARPIDLDIETFWKSNITDVKTLLMSCVMDCNPVVNQSSLERYNRYVSPMDIAAKPVIWMIALSGF